MAVRRDRRPARNEGITDASHATTSRRFDVPSWAPEQAHGRLGCSIRVASLHTAAFTRGRHQFRDHAPSARRPWLGDNQVGTQYAQRDPELVLPDDQVIKPIGDRLLTNSSASSWASTVRPGRPVPRGNQRRQGRWSSQTIDPSTYKLTWTVRQCIRGQSPTDNLKVSDGTSVGQEGPTYSPDGKFLWLPVVKTPRRPVPGQRRRHPGYADLLLDPDGGQPPFG